MDIIELMKMAETKIEKKVKRKKKIEKVLDTIAGVYNVAGSYLSEKKKFWCLKHHKEQAKDGRRREKAYRNNKEIVALSNYFSSIPSGQLIELCEQPKKMLRMVRQNISEFNYKGFEVKYLCKCIITSHRKLLDQREQMLKNQLFDYNEELNCYCVVIW